MTYEAKFIKLRVVLDEKGKTSDVVYPLTFIKNISNVEVQSEIIAGLTPVIGKCAITLFDGGQFMVDHTLEEMCQVLQATDAPKIIAALQEKSEAALQ